jgi:general stress protein YciG
LHHAVIAITDIASMREARARACCDNFIDLCWGDRAPRLCGGDTRIGLIWTVISALVTGTTVASYPVVPNPIAGGPPESGAAGVHAMIWNADENNAGGTEQQSADNNQTPSTTSSTPETPSSSVSNEGGGDGATTNESTTVGAAPTTTVTTEERRPRRRGFAAMDRDRVREIASKGGKAAHAAGTAHQFSSDEARVAGRKGGMAPHVRRGGVRRRPNGDTGGPAGGGAPTQGQGEHGSDNR